ncbi:MAG: pseudouridine synthase [Usitatibacteraceae bacterium]
MLIRFNKPYGVICQFSPSGDKPTLKNFIALPDVYPVGRLDTDREGLLLLTDDGRLQSKIADPRHKLPKTYWAEVEGEPTDADLAPLRKGVDLGDFVTLPANLSLIPVPAALWPRVPPVRVRKSIPTSWLSITICEGKNRQVRRMTANIGFPTLRLVRAAIGEWGLEDLEPGQWQIVTAPNVLLSAQNRPQRPKRH